MVAANDWVAEADAILREETVRVLRDVPLRSRTSLGVGGPARLVVAAAGAEDLARVMSRFAQASVPFDFLGAGSNLLVADEDEVCAEPFEATTLPLLRLWTD